MAQDMLTIMQAILNTQSSRSPVPIQASNAQVMPGPDASGDDVPSKLIVS